MATLRQPLCSLPAWHGRLIVHRALFSLRTDDDASHNCIRPTATLHSGGTSKYFGVVGWLALDERSSLALSSIAARQRRRQRDCFRCGQSLLSLSSLACIRAPAHAFSAFSPLTVQLDGGPLVQLQLEGGGSLQARLLVGADGRGSRVRQWAQVGCGVADVKLQQEGCGVGACCARCACYACCTCSCC